MDFNSKYKSSEIEERLDKAGTAVQPNNLAAVATSGSYDDLDNKPTIPAEQVNADWSATSGKAQILNKPTIPDISGKVDKVSGKGLSTNDYTTTEKNKLAGIASGAEVNVQSDWNETNSSSDAYIKNKPTIPSAVTENTVSGWGFTKNTGTYSKPSTGIPKSDLASSVQTSLSKADSALQSYTEQYKGTVTGVKINGSTKNPSNGVVDLGTVLTAHQDISGKQDKLVSGTNIKTVNGQSILGSGDITISGGGGEQIEEPYVAEVNGAKFIVFDNTTVDNTPINTPMMPNVTYVCTEPVDGVILYNIQLPTGNIGKYTLHFETGAEGGVIAINPDFYLYSPNGALNTELEPYGVYELSIVATKLVENGATYWLYKAVLTSFTY